MKNYLSMGFGVNSVALYLWLKDNGIEFEAVYSDHGADMPKTKEYIKYFTSLFPVTIIKPKIKRKGLVWDNLIDFCRDRKVIPQQWPRWCTGDFKKDVLNKYFSKPCIVYIGISSEEAKRSKIKMSGKISYKYPFVDMNIDRDGCKDIIRNAGLKIPPKSSCFFCPFQRKEQWKNLRKNHYNLYKLAIELEENTTRTFRRNKPLRSWIGE